MSLVGLDVDVYATRASSGNSGGLLTQVVGPTRYNRVYKGINLQTTDGRIEDPEMLDIITR